GEPYTILMPPPNANASLHAGHAMYTVDDILIRFKRMQGYSVSWIPGMDHAGFETQYVYEKHLSKEGKSRMDFDRKTLYQKIFDFVKEYSGLNYKQFKRLGFSADWDKSIFTLDEKVISKVNATFEKMEKEGLIYRDSYIVNFCTHCGTSLAELEVKHVERIDPLYYIKYGPFVLATVRPETKFGDTAVAVHPNDQRYKNFIGKEIEVEGLLGKFTLRVVADEAVDPEFGTGVVKVTPGHDPVDWEIGKRHNLEIKSVIDLRGKLTSLAGKYEGLNVKDARIKVAEDLQKINLIEKIDKNYLHGVITCYKCGRDLEPLTVPNWFIKVEDLKNKVKKVVEDEKIKFYPKRFKKHMLAWLSVMHDWPISRQIVWGIRIPVWYDIDKNKDIIVSFIDKRGNKKFGNIHDFDFSEVEKGLQTVRASVNSSYIISTTKPKGKFLPETDTFDTWFSSGQWPLVVIPENELNSRFPTDFIGTLSDILKFWISRMIMFSIYLKKDIPFKDVYLWSMVADSKGVKMSKSKGNVISPIDLIDKYGADSLRMSLIYGTPAGSKVILSDEKVRAMRNFSNKIWNLGRYLQLSFEKNKEISFEKPKSMEKEDEKIIRELGTLTLSVTKSLDKYNLNTALENIYEFAWHNFADIYIEKTKERIENKNISGLYTLKHVYLTILKLLHPFAPFVTEAVWSELKDLRKYKTNLILSSWPK
ncbi:MAG: valine--tRNA ligase, partial [Candidatus Woesebacteria bacterium]|nr:valine--tRNA ligase [Candidatus Woesebacteria bacterium]